MHKFMPCCSNYHLYHFSFNWNHAWNHAQQIENYHYCRRRKQFHDIQIMKFKSLRNALVEFDNYKY